MKTIGDTVYFGSRQGYVVGYWTGKMHGHAEKVETYYVVELKKHSAGWIIGDNRREDVFCRITLILIHPSNINR